MFLNSSKSIKSKIIEAAIQVDAEYRMYRATNRSYQLATEAFATKYPDVRETACQSTEQVPSPGKSLPNLVSARPHLCSCIGK